MTEQAPIYRLISHMKERRSTMWLATLFSILNKIFDLAPPLLIGAAVDVVARQEESVLSNYGYTDPKDQLIILSILTVIIWVFESLFEYIYGVLWRNLAQTVQHELRLDAYSHIQELEMAWFSDQSKGELMSILNDDINQLERFLDKGANELLQVGTTVVIISAIFFYISPAIAIYSIIPIPVVFVGSQRSSDRPSSDAALNLIAATRLIVETDARGVYVVMHHNESDDTISCHLGTRVRKNHTSKRSAFETVGNDPAFLILNEKIIKNSTGEFFTDQSFNPRLGIDTKVALVKYHPGYEPRQIDTLIDLGLKAIIFEGTGLGHVGKTMYDAIKKANQNGLFLGMTSQCIDGRVRMTVYESGRDLLEMGITPLENMIPEVALVKTMWALGNSKDNNGLKKLLLENIASEFSE